VAPGRYRGEFPVSADGRYYLSVSGGDGERQVGPRTFGLAVPYSSEYVNRGVDNELLQDLAATTGGQVLPLAVDSLATLTRPAARADVRRFRIWWPWLLVALVALVLEVAVRKVGLPETWLRRWQQLRPASGSPQGAQDEYEQLQAAMTRVREQHVAAARTRFFYDPHDPAARARLYLGGGRGSRR